MSLTLKQLRLLSGLNQKELGDIIGVSSISISKWESLLVRPSDENITKLANFFNVSFEEIEKNLKPIKVTKEDLSWKLRNTLKKSEESKKIINSLVQRSIRDFYSNI